MSQEADYYTAKHYSLLWHNDWLKICSQVRWFSGQDPAPNPITPMFDSYHPFGCNACKRGPLTGNKLKKCSFCRVVKYCSKEHQKMDWPLHKAWCQAFVESTSEIPYDIESWRAYSRKITNKIIRKLGQRGTIHTSNSQVAAMQPRCRKCFVAAADGSSLKSCPKCHGVALCKKCHSQHPSGFHDSAEKGGLKDCDAYILALACDGMVVDQGTLLVIESDSDCECYFRPKDWIDYFSKKSNDFHAIPQNFMSVAPVVSLLTDGLSLPLTIQHVLSQVTSSADRLSKLVVHIVGASANDEFYVGKYLELVRLNPTLTHLRVIMIGPNLEDPSFPQDGRPLNFQNPSASHVRDTCDARLIRRKGYYHNVAPTLEPPSIVVASHSGLHDVVYTQMWRPTIEYLTGQQSVPCIFTGYNHSEVIQDAAVLIKFGCNVVIPPTPNPFRGMRPFLDPMRDPSNFYYSNASFVVFQGSSDKGENTNLFLK